MKDVDLFMPIIITGLAIFGGVVLLAQCDAEADCHRRGGIYAREFIGYRCVEVKKVQP